ncbi:MAG: LysM domain-containing protein [Chloroflexota bacterium]
MMSFWRMRGIQAVLLPLTGLLILGLGSCTSTVSPVDSQPTPTWVLTPYVSPTFIATSTPASVLITTPVPLPTPTPFTYTIQKDDTMIGIAVRFGIQLEDLVAVNPGVDPRFLTVGETLIIPLGEEGGGMPLPTPVPLTLSLPICYSTAEGGSWCFLLVENNQSQAMENLSVRFTLFDEGSTLVEDQVAYGLLDRVMPGEVLPIGVFFPPPLPSPVYPVAQLVSAFPVPPEDERYLEIQIEIASIETFDESLWAEVKGSLWLTEEGSQAQAVWLLVAGFDTHGNMVALRRWEAEGALNGGEQLPFQMQVFSIGLPLADVRVWGEAHR